MTLCNTLRNHSLWMILCFAAGSSAGEFGVIIRSHRFSSLGAGRVLRGHDVERMGSNSVTRCIVRCTNNPDCSSVNYYQEIKLCEINAATIEDYPADVVEDNQGNYFSPSFGSEISNQATTTSSVTTHIHTTAKVSTTPQSPTTFADTTAHIQPTTFASTTPESPTTYADTTTRMHSTTSAPTTTQAPTTYSETTAHIQPTTSAPTTTQLPTTILKTTELPTTLSATTQHLSTTIVTSPSITTEATQDVVMQRRLNGGLDFYRLWADYVNGFSDGTEGGEIWIGLDLIHNMTSSVPCGLRIELSNGTNYTVYAEYSDFMITDEASYYSLNIKGYSGTAGDSLSGLAGVPFSTSDQDNNAYSAKNEITSYLHGAWWMSDMRPPSHLNGVYQATGVLPGVGQGVYWSTAGAVSWTRSVMTIIPSSGSGWTTTAAAALPDKQSLDSIG